MQVMQADKIFNFQFYRPAIYSIYIAVVFASRDPSKAAPRAPNRPFLGELNWNYYEVELNIMPTYLT